MLCWHKGANQAQNRSYITSFKVTWEHRQLRRREEEKIPADWKECYLIKLPNKETSVYTPAYTLFLPWSFSRMTSELSIATYMENYQSSSGQSVPSPLSQVARKKSATSTCGSRKCNEEKEEVLLKEVRMVHSCLPGLQRFVGGWKKMQIEILESVKHSRENKLPRKYDCSARAFKIPTPWCCDVMFMLMFVQ